MKKEKIHDFFAYILFLLSFPIVFPLMLVAVTLDYIDHVKKQKYERGEK